MTYDKDRIITKEKLKSDAQSSMSEGQMMANNMNPWLAGLIGMIPIAIVLYLALAYFGVEGIWIPMTVILYLLTVFQVHREQKALHK